MALEIAVQPPKLEEFFDREKAGFSPRGVKQRRCVTLGKDETVVVIKFWIFRVIAHMTEEKRCDQICRRTTRSWMSAPRRRRCFNGMNAQLIGNSFQTFCVDIVHAWSKLYARMLKRKVDLEWGPGLLRHAMPGHTAG